MNDTELLTLHRELVEVPSPSRDEARVCEFVSGFLEAHGHAPERLGNNLYVAVGEPPYLCFNSHLDTVPASNGWQRPPHRAVREDGKVYGLGSNDAKASVAAMIAAFLRLAVEPERRGGLLLALAAEEECGGKGSELLVPALARRGLTPAAVVVGEPTGLDVAVAQKGLLVLELVASGQACHAAHAHRLGADNALRLLARDLVALERADLGPADPDLGPVTLEPTMVSGGTAKNMVPAEARAVLDVRVNPGENPAVLVTRLRRLVAGELRVLSDRLRPVAIHRDHPLVSAAQLARPEATLMGSRGVSDLVFFRDIPGIKVGPGQTERSHTADEFVLESEIIQGAQFYERLARAFQPPPAASGAPS
ncbi:MAG: M20/M25/M40 family metallo-hydrolase [Deltaproteobacteria bacterium]|nr:M20/M25/M40 family metallo-hydrolase [Deltaproteobacteria bacterium]